MKISYAPYQLHYKLPLPSREGTLLRVEFPNGETGYADCHPWDIAGDLPWSEQLKLISHGTYTQLTMRSLLFARLDAQARKKQRSLFKDVQIPDSHLLIPDIVKGDLAIIPEAIKNGIRRFKIKMGKDVNQETPKLLKLLELLQGTPAKVCLDFNLRLSQLEFEKFHQKTDSWKQFIDFYEDPFPYDAEAWSRTQAWCGVDFAADHDSEIAMMASDAAKVIVLKPAIQDAFLLIQKCATKKRVLITSYLDHPLGQLSAAYAAAQCAQKIQLDLCGLITHLVYQPNAFSERLSKLEPQLQPPDGTGFGFDDLLAQQSWKDV